MIYLANAYSYDPDESYMDVSRVLAEFIHRGLPVFSPIVHSHLVAEVFDMPTGWEFWRDLDFQYIDACSEVWVWRDPSGQWEKSVGVQAEIEYARSNGKPVRFFDEPEEMP